VVRATLPAGATPPPYGLASAHRCGWIRHLPLQRRTLLFGFCRGADMADDDVLAVLQQSVSGAALTDVGTGALPSGRREYAWRGNCVALGSAAAIIDPLAASNLQLALSGIARLLRLLPGEGSATAIAAEYNRQSSAWLDQARDFAMLHYKLNGRHGEALWDACREMSIPDTLAYRLALYRSRGRIVMYDEEPYDESAWISLFDGMRVEPRHYSQAADGFETGEIDAHCRRVRQVLLDALRRMPAHAEFLHEGRFTDFVANPAESDVVGEIGKLSPES
jgi:tryptophan halogenase